MLVKELVGQPNWDPQYKKEPQTAVAEFQLKLATGQLYAKNPLATDPKKPIKQFFFRFIKFFEIVLMASTLVYKTVFTRDRNT